MKRINHLVLLLFVFVWSCTSSDPEVLTENQHFLEIQKIGSASKNEILQKYGGLIGNNPLVNGLLQYDVEYHRLSYKTKNTDGLDIVASGAVVIPKKKEKSTLLSLQHGTILNESEAPSYFVENTEGSMSIVLGSLGFIALMPDYVGYGLSKNQPHPYEHAKGLAEPNVDFLLAVKEYLKQENIPNNNKLLLAGYSEGGYSTLVTQRLLEEKHADKFNIVASSAGAGAYHKSALMKKFINEETVGEVAHNRSYIWVMQTYNRIHKLNKPMNYYFKENIAKQIETNGHNVSISGSFNSLLNPEFVKSFNDGKEVELSNAFKENDVINWKTNVNTSLFHGNQDVYVPYFNSVDALEGMKKAGSKNVSLETIEGGKHDTAIQTFIIQTLLLFLGHRI